MATAPDQPTGTLSVSTLHADVFDRVLTDDERRGLQPLEPDGPAFGERGLGDAAGWIHRFVPNPEATPDPDTGLFGACLFLGMAGTGQAVRKLVHQHVAEALPLSPDDVVLSVPLRSVGVFPASEGECAALAEVPSVILPRELRKSGDADGAEHDPATAALRREQYRPAARRNAPPTAAELADAAPIWHTDEATGERQLRTDVVFRQREIHDTEVTAEERAKVAYRSKMGALDPVEVGLEPATELLECREEDVRAAAAASGRARPADAAEARALLPPTDDDMQDARLQAADLQRRIAFTRAALDACDERIDAAEKTRDNYLRRILAAHDASPDFQRLWVARYVAAVLDSGLQMDSAANRSDPANMLYHLHLDGEEEWAVMDTMARMRAEQQQATARKRR